jgi:hypothetical protein
MLAIDNPQIAQAIKRSIETSDKSYLPNVLGQKCSTDLCDTVFSNDKFIVHYLQIKSEYYLLCHSCFKFIVADSAKCLLFDGTLQELKTQ